MNKHAFSLVELIIVIAIVMILAAAGLTGYSSISTNLRFNNTFNRIVQMVEQARSMAITGKGTAGGYGVIFSFGDISSGADDKIELFSGTVDNFATWPTTTTDKSVIDSLIIRKSSNLRISVPNASIPACNAYATIFFENNPTKISLFCNDVKMNERMTFRLEDIANPTHEKSFSIHKAAGIPQL